MRTLILCAVPRSGSTLLCDLLRATGVAGWPESWFRPGSIPEFAADWGVPQEGPAYLRAAIEAGRAGTQTFAVRLMRDHLPEMMRRLAAEDPRPGTDTAWIDRAFGPATYVWLRREDLVAQAVSRLRAEQSGLWHRAADGSVREQVGPRRRARYDPARIADFLAEAEEAAAGWASWFDAGGVTPLRLTYEGLIADPHAAVRVVLAALGADPDHAGGVRPATRRLADRTSLRWAERFRGERTAQGIQAR